MVRDSAGVRLVSNPEAGIWTEQTRWIAEPDLTIGEREGAPEYEFARIADVDAGPDGRIYVLDNQTARVSVYDAEGRFVLSFGKLGRGPGEFSIDAFALLVGPEGVVRVRDGINRRDNLFDADGTFLRAIPLTGAWKEWAVLPGGEQLARASSPTWDGIVRIGADGVVIDTVVVFDYDIAAGRGALSSAPVRESGGRIEIRLLPSLPAWGVTSDGRVLTGISNRYRIEVRRPDRVLEMLVEKAHPPLSLSAADRGSVLERMKELMGDAGLSDDQIAAALQRFTYQPPDSFPAFSGLAGGPDGTIWVQGVLPIESMTANDVLDALNAGSSGWDVFCRDGRYLGEIALPPGFDLKSIRGFYAYGVATDELDVQRVVRLRLRPAMEGPEAGLSCA